MSIGDAGAEKTIKQRLKEKIGSELNRLNTYITCNCIKVEAGEEKKKKEVFCFHLRDEEKKKNPQEISRKYAKTPYITNLSKTV